MRFIHTRIDMLIESLGTDNGDGGKQNHFSVLYTSQHPTLLDFNCFLKYQSFI